MNFHEQSALADLASVDTVSRNAALYKDLIRAGWVTRTKEKAPSRGAIIWRYQLTPLGREALG